MDTHTGLNSIYFKTGKLDNLYRTPELELIAGEEGSIVEVKEEQCRFLLNIRSVYYCSRLQTERARVLSQIPKESILFDPFCGVGPFSLQFAKRKNSIAIANDLNPECLFYFRKNQKKNKVKSKSIGFHSDARQFLKLMLQVVSQMTFIHLKISPSQESISKIRELFLSYNVLYNLSGQQNIIDNFNIIESQLLKISANRRFIVYMNLPGENIDFLDALDFKLVTGILGEMSQFQVELDFYVTCFEEINESSEKIYEEAKKRIIERVSEPNQICKLEWEVDFKECKEIKNVSSTKIMLCVHFGLKLKPKKNEHSLLGAHNLNIETQELSLIHI